MNFTSCILRVSVSSWLVFCFHSAPAAAQSAFADVAAKVNPRLVKVYGSGGFRGVVDYGTGVVLSPDGYVLTVNAQLLDTPDLRVHLSDGRRCQAKVVVIEPALDVALVKIEKVDDLPHFDFASAVKRPAAKAGDWVLAFSNTFKIATRDEPMSVQRGVVAAVARLPLTRGLNEAPYTGEVYVVDAVTNNPGANGGALTTRSGELLGLVGRELRNTLSDTWINYAIPITAKIDVRDGDIVRTVSMAEFVEKGMKGEYKPTAKIEKSKDLIGGYTGIVLVPNVVERTPPYIEEVLPNSPAFKAGLRPDDLIVYFEGEPVVSIANYKDLLGRSRPGVTVKIEVRRGEKLVTVDLTLDEFPKK